MERVETIEKMFRKQVSIPWPQVKTGERRELPPERPALLPSRWLSFLSRALRRR